MKKFLLFGGIPKNVWLRITDKLYQTLTSTIYTESQVLHEDSKVSYVVYGANVFDRIEKML